MSMIYQDPAPPGLVNVWPMPTATQLEDTEMDPVPRGSESAVCSSHLAVAPRSVRTSPTSRTRDIPRGTPPLPTQTVNTMSIK